jgi:hypothetical protein
MPANNIEAATAPNRTAEIIFDFLCSSGCHPDPNIVALPDCLLTQEAAGTRIDLGHLSTFGARDVGIGLALKTITVDT